MRLWIRRFLGATNGEILTPLHSGSTQTALTAKIFQQCFEMARWEPQQKCQSQNTYCVPPKKWLALYRQMRPLKQAVPRGQKWHESKFSSDFGQTTYRLERTRQSFSSSQFSMSSHVLVFRGSYYPLLQRRPPETTNLCLFWVLRPLETKHQSLLSEWKMHL